MKRNTIQRKLILEAVNELKHHPTADEVFLQISQAYPDISKATVYRNLNQLADELVLKRVAVPNGADKFDITTAEHSHFVCNICGKYIDISISNLDVIDNEILMLYNLKVESREVILRGICQDCRVNV